MTEHHQELEQRTAATEIQDKESKTKTGVQGEEETRHQLARGERDDWGDDQHGGQEHET